MSVTSIDVDDLEFYRNFATTFWDILHINAEKRIA